MVVVILLGVAAVLSLLFSISFGKLAQSNRYGSWNLDHSTLIRQDLAYHSKLFTAYSIGCGVLTGFFGYFAYLAS
jgi:hypothetical protein